MADPLIDIAFTVTPVVVDVSRAFMRVPSVKSAKSVLEAIVKKE
jgi:hypothetical protein